MGRFSGRSRRFGGGNTALGPGWRPGEKLPLERRRRVVYKGLRQGGSGHPNASA